jgi:hypothetical protein
VISLSWERIDFCSAVIYEQNRPTHQHGLQREFTNSSRCRCSSGRTNSRMVVFGSYPETGFGEINANLLEADFSTAWL